MAEDIPAPMGLTWGASDDDLTSKFGAIKAGDQKGYEIFIINKPPITLGNIDSVIGITYPKLGLVKVVLASTISNDAFGTAGSKLYADFKAKLTEKYGKPKSYEYINKKLYTEADEYYQCLNYEGCGSMISFFKEGQPSNVSLELSGKMRGEGALKISYESNLFSESQKSAEKELQRKESAGL